MGISIHPFKGCAVDLDVVFSFWFYFSPSLQETFSNLPFHLKMPDLPGPSFFQSAQMISKWKRINRAFKKSRRI